LLAVPAELRGLLAGFRLTYADAACSVCLPLRLAYLQGFGGLGATSESPFGETENEYDILIVDAFGQTVVDTSKAECCSRKLANRLRTVTWLSATFCCHLTFHTAWTQEDIDDGVATDYPQGFAVSEAVLDPRTTICIPRRVDSLTVDLSTFSRDIVLAAGYNILLESDSNADPYAEMREELRDRVLLDGLVMPVGTFSRTVKKIRVSAIPGAGTGRAPGCTDEAALSVKTISGQKPDNAGNLIIQTTGTYRLSHSLRQISEEPRTFEFYRDGKTEDEAKATLVLKDDGQICCGCNDYVFVYRGVSRQWNRWKDLAAHSGAIRDWHDDNLARWEAARRCRQNRTTRVAITPERNGKIAGGIVFCNNTGCCLTSVTVRVTMLVYRNGIRQDRLGGDCHMSSLSNDTAVGGKDSYHLAGEWPVYEAYVDAISPNDSTRLAFRLFLRDFAAGEDVVQAVASIHYPDPVSTDPDKSCQTSLESPDSLLQQIWENSVCGLPKSDTRAIVYSSLIPMTDKPTQRRVCTVLPSSQSA
jgi:hypothetical protein